MAEELTGPDLFADASAHLDAIAEGEAEGFLAGGREADNRALYALMAIARAVQANTAAMVMHTGVVAEAECINSRELDAWKEVLPIPAHPESADKES